MIHSDDVTENRIYSFDKSFVLNKRRESKSFDKVSNLNEKHWEYFQYFDATI